MNPQPTPDTFRSHPALIMDPVTDSESGRPVPSFSDSPEYRSDIMVSQGWSAPLNPISTYTTVGIPLSGISDDNPVDHATASGLALQSHHTTHSTEPFLHEPTFGAPTSHDSQLDSRSNVVSGSSGSLDYGLASAPIFPTSYHPTMVVPNSDSSQNRLVPSTLGPTPPTSTTSYTTTPRVPNAPNAKKKALISGSSNQLGGPTRRQHRSCDQCRKGKRACDASIPPAEVALARKLAQAPTKEEIDKLLPQGPCTNCSKTNKICTFNWLTAQLTSTPVRRTNADGSTSRRKCKTAGSDGLNVTDLNDSTTNPHLAPAPGFMHDFSVPSGSTPVPSRIYAAEMILPTLPPFMITQNQSVNDLDEGISELSSPPRIPYQLLSYESISSTPSQPPIYGQPLRDPFLPHRSDPSVLFDQTHEVDLSASTNFQIPMYGQQDICNQSPQKNDNSSLPQWQYGEGTTSNQLNTEMGLDETYNGNFHEVSSEIPSAFHLSNEPGLGGFSTTMMPPGVSYIPAGSVEVTTDDPAISSGTEIVYCRVQNRDDLDRKRKRSVSFPNRPPLNFSISDLPYLPAEMKMFGSLNLALVSQNLMRLYNDSMENALSCWLSMRTCPFKSLSDWSADEFVEEEWGPGSSNRILGRVFSLDRALSAAIKKPFAQRDDRLATRALHLVTLAFAAQWSQSSERGQEKYKDNNSNDHGFGTGTKAFDRSLYETIWPMARQALVDATGVESFRVVFANVIFAMTQAPLTSVSSENGDLDELTQAAAKWSLDDIDEALECDGPPVFLEQSLRTLHSIRVKLNSLEKAQMHPVIGRKDRQTIGMISWLVVMLDTLSSVVNDRPLVISDVDSNTTLGVNDSGDAPSWGTESSPSSLMVPSLSSSTSTTTSSSSSSPLSSYDLWDDFFFAQQGVYRHSNGAPVRWPCSYEEAAAVLCDAAPVKVLMYRKITQLQGVLARGMYGEPVEMVIHEILLINAHWNLHFDPFVRDCISNHASLPAKVQSWYICMVMHWYLGIMIVADVMAMVDSHGHGLRQSTDFRTTYSLAARMKQDSAYAISDLGRCACPQDIRQDAPPIMLNTHAKIPNLSDIPGFFGEHAGDSEDLHAQMRQTQRLESMSSDPGSRSYSPAPLDNFHFALNEGALLTEPWSALQVRAFAKAATAMLTDYDCGVVTPPSPLPDMRLQRLIEAAAYPYKDMAADESGFSTIPLESFYDVYQDAPSSFYYPQPDHPVISPAYKDDGIPGYVPSRDILTRCEECVRALWYLGKKSDTSRMISTIVRRGLDERITKINDWSDSNFSSSPDLPTDHISTAPVGS